MIRNLFVSHASVIQIIFVSSCSDSATLKVICSQNYINRSYVLHDYIAARPAYLIHPYYVP